MKALSANRVVLILGIIITVAGAAATYVAGVTNSLPTSWQADAAIIVTILGSIAGVTTSVLKFLDGSQKSEALQARAQPHASPAGARSAAAPEPAPEAAGAAHDDFIRSRVAVLPETEVVTVDRLPIDAFNDPNPFSGKAAGFPDPGDQEPVPEPSATGEVQAA